MQKSIALGIVATVALLGFSASSAYAGFCGERFAMPEGAEDTKEQPCRDVDGNIIGIGRLFNGAAQTVRARLVAGRTFFGVMGIRSNGQLALDCTVNVTAEFPVEQARLEDCEDTVGMLMQGF